MECYKKKYSPMHFMNIVIFIVIKVQIGFPSVTIFVIKIIIKVSIKIRWVVINIFITWTIFIMMGTH
jgi:hypothetical protein